MPCQNSPAAEVRKIEADLTRRDLCNLAHWCLRGAW